MPSMPRAGAGVCHNMCARKKKGFLGAVGGCPVPCALRPVPCALCPVLWNGTGRALVVWKTPFNKTRWTRDATRC